MCDRHRFQTAEILPALPAFATRNAPDIAIFNRTRPGSTEVDMIPSSTNSLQPRFGITNPAMFAAARVDRTDGIVYAPGAIENEAPPHGYPVILPEHPAAGLNVQPYQALTYPSSQQTIVQEGLLDVNSPRRRNMTLNQQDSDHHIMPGTYHIASTPTSTTNSIDQSHYTGQTNGQLPPMPSIISPSAVAISSGSANQYHFGLGLSTGESLTASQSTSGLPFTSASSSNQLWERNGDMAIDQGTEDTDDGGILASTAMVMSSSSSSLGGLGRSASVPEPIIMQHTRQPSYGSKKPEEIDTEAPGFSYKNHFKKAYVTGMSSRSSALFFDWFQVG
jgi:hypothetical protein